MTEELTLKIDSIAAEIQAAPEILQNNEMSVSKCNAAGQTLLDTIESEGGNITSEQLDADVKDYIEKVKVTVTKMNDRRKPVTQLLTAISKRFTTLESEIDPKGANTVPFKLQRYRNAYAAAKIEEQRRKDEEIKRRQLAENEKISYRSDLTTKLNIAYNCYTGELSDSLNRAFNDTTLGNYDTTLATFNQFPPVFIWNEYVKKVRDDITLSFIDPETRDRIKKEVAAERKADFVKRFATEFEELKASYLERMPSKKKALEEEAELRVKNAEAAAAAEAERKQREAEDRAKAEAERRLREAEAAAKAEAEKKAAEAMNAFNMVAMQEPATVKAKVTKKIEVANPKGFIEIYNLWFMREGVNMSMEELEKVHKKMITFCEKEANRDGGETIKSAFVKYVDEVKAK